MVTIMLTVKLSNTNDKIALVFFFFLFDFVFNHKYIFNCFILFTYKEKDNFKTQMLHCVYRMHCIKINLFCDSVYCGDFECFPSSRYKKMESNFQPNKLKLKNV